MIFMCVTSRVTYGSGRSKRRGSHMEVDGQNVESHKSMVEFIDIGSYSKINPKSFMTSIIQFSNGVANGSL